MGDLLDKATASFECKDSTSKRTVKVRTVETHDDEECTCITKVLVLTKYDRVTLTHVCHDGRKDVLSVEILEII